MPILSMKNYEPSARSRRLSASVMPWNARSSSSKTAARRSNSSWPSLRPRSWKSSQKAIPPGKSVEYYLASYNEIDESLRKVSDPFSFTQYR